jgi:flagellar hook-associated protein 1 FlgK
VADLLGIATSGLLAFQRSLDTTGHNIANASTPGYTRQRVELGTQIPQLSGAGFIGSGVQVETVRRLYDGFLTDRVRSTTSTSSSLDIYHDFATRVSNLLGNAQAGLNAGIQDFFDSVQGVADDPTSIPARQVMLSEAESLETRFQYLNGQLDTLRSEIDRQVTGLTSQMSSLAESIASINQEIVLAMGNAGGQPPNDLLDKRDHMLQELSELVSIRTFEQDDGSVNVSIGNGQALVTGSRAATLTVSGNEFDASQMEIVFQVGTSSAVVTDSISGGQLGGLMEFRAGVLDSAQNSLGRIGIAMASEFNAQHALGMDLNGNPGNAFFAVGASQVFPSNNNSGSGTVSVAYDTANFAALKVDDYVLGYDGSNYALTRVSDGSTVPMSGAGTAANPFQADGLSIVVGGAPVANDRVLIRPTRAAANGFGVLIGDAQQIAAAAPVRISEATNANGAPTNSGNAAVKLNGVDSTFGPLSAGITLTYDAANLRFNYTGDASGTISYDPVTDTGATYTIAGVTFSVSSTPANGDQFVLSDNSNGTGDNTNALLLSGLQTAAVLDGGSNSFEGAYAKLIAETGLQTRQAEIDSEAQHALLAQARESREAASGVNLDEEAANLLRFQQQYQAMAQVIRIADSLFESLLGAVRR